MRRISNLLIALPILAMPLAAAGLRPAFAEGVAAQEAVQILTRARIADQRCQILQGAEHEELARYTARAEAAASQQISMEAAKSAVVAGAAEGSAATCDATTRSDVSETLVAARQAVKAADSGQMRLSREQSGGQPDNAGGAETGQLEFYAGQVKAYYLERKCRHLSAEQDMRYWKAIGHIHQAAVARNGASAVAPVMRRAETSATATSCGGETLVAVKAGFAGAIRR